MKKYQYYHICAMLWGIFGYVLNDPLSIVAWIVGIVCGIISIFSEK